MSGNEGKLLLGFVVLHVLCCGLLLLGVGGAVGVAGVVVSSPGLVLAGIGVVLVAVAVALAVRRARGARRADSCIRPRDSAESAPSP